MSFVDSAGNAAIRVRAAELMPDTVLEEDFLAEMGQFDQRMSAIPLLIGSSDWNELAQGLEDLGTALERFVECYEHHQEVRELFDVYAELEPWILDWCRTSPVVHGCRFDGVWHGGGEFSVMETNAGGPSAVFHLPKMTRSWAATRWAQTLLKGVELDHYPLVRDPFLFAKEMLAAAAAHGHDVRAAALVRWCDGAGVDEPHVLAALREAGCVADVLNARDLVWRNGLARAAGRDYQLLHSNLKLPDVVAEPLAADFVRLHRSDRVFLTAAAVTQIVVEDKAVLAVLSDPAFESLFCSRQRAAARRHVPWTRLVRAGRTTGHDGSPINLLDHVAENRRELVLKPANLHGGNGVVVGPAVTDEQWWNALAKAVKERYVVQRYVPLPRSDFPVFGGASVHDAYSDVMCYLVEGRLVGLASRVSAKPVVNLASGGACFVPVLRTAS